MEGRNGPRDALALARALKYRRFMSDAIMKRQVTALIGRCYAGLDVVGLRDEVLCRLRRIMSVDAAFFGTVDPETLLFTSAVAEDPLGAATPLFLDNEYGRSDVNKFAALAEAADPVSSLDRATRGQRPDSARYREVMSPLGLGDELRAVLISGKQCWGAICLHREDAEHGFDDQEVDVIRRIAPHVAEGLRRAVTLGSLRAPAHLQVLPDGERREDVVGLRHVAEPGPGDLLRGQAGDVAAAGRTAIRSPGAPAGRPRRHMSCRPGCGTGSARFTPPPFRWPGWARTRRTPSCSPPLLVDPDGVPQAQKGPDIGHESAQVLVRLPKPVLDAAQPGPSGQPLLVEHPFAGGRHTALGRGQHRLAQVRQAGDPVLTADVDIREVQRPSCQPEPGIRRGRPQLLRESRARQVTGQHSAKSQFPGQNVGGDPGHVANLTLDLELTLPGGRGPAQDLVQVPVDEVDLGAIDREPGPAIHDAAPFAGREDPARPAERDDLGRVQPAPVIQAEVPV